MKQLYTSQDNVHCPVSGNCPPQRQHFQQLLIDNEEYFKDMPFQSSSSSSITSIDSSTQITWTSRDKPNLFSGPALQSRRLNLTLQRALDCLGCYTIVSYLEPSPSSKKKKKKVDLGKFDMSKNLLVEQLKNSYFGLKTQIGKLLKMCCYILVSFSSLISRNCTELVLWEL